MYKGGFSRVARGRGTLASAVLLGSASLAGGFASPAQAQEAEASAARTYDIPAQPLESALVVFGRQSRLQVTAEADLVAGRRSSAVSGSLAAGEALSHLLAGTGLTFRFVGPSAVRIERAPRAAEGAVQLGPVRVEGAVEASSTYYDPTFGAVAGLVAEESVSATKSNLSVVRTPATVSVVTREQMDALKPQTIGDVLKYSAGVLTGGNDDRRFELPGGSMRGFGAIAMLDGTRLNGNIGYYSSNPSIEPYLLERVEVLSGPASLLYGESSPGGVISMMSKRPTETPVREVILGSGSFGRKQLALDFGGALNQSNTILARITAIGIDTGTDIKYARDERIAIAPALTVKLAERTSLTVLGTYQNDPAKPGYYRTLPRVGTFTPATFGYIPRDLFLGEPGYNEFKRKQYTIGYEFNHRFTDWLSFEQTFKYLHIRGHYRDMFPTGYTQDGLSITRNFFGTDDAKDSTNFDSRVKAKFATGAVSHDLTLGFDYGSVHDLEDGYIYEQTTPLNVLNPVYGNFDPNPYNDTTPYQYGMRRIGAYAQDVFQVSGWTAVLGLRQDWARAWSASPSPRTYESSEALTGRGGLLYAFDNGLAPYVSYSSSFEPQSGTTAPQRGRERFKPTTGQQFEAGLKYSPKSFPAIASVAVYQLKQQNVLTGDPDYDGYSIQRGEVRSRGVTANVTLSPRRGVNLIANYAYTDLITSKATPDLSDPVGKVPYYQPKHNASIWGEYQPQSGPLRGLRLASGLRWISWGYTDSRETDRLPGYLLADAAATLELGTLASQFRNVELSVNASNLFDKTYLVSCVSSANGGCHYGDARKILVNLRANW